MLQFRAATKTDLPKVIRLLADDPLGKGRERFEVPLPAAYVEAFQAMLGQDGNRLIVAIEDQNIVGCLQLVIIPGLSHLGTTRGQIESVRVERNSRGKGVDEALFRHAFELAREAGCGLVQLTTDKARPDARRFYERLGFVDSHIGMKLAL
ncbi:MAG: GNAT family N-acetyltransferase [Kiloniellales bacterium]|nr:GNAT family N-acetyltransferase [Kiloniellales bacterium]